MLGLPTSVCSVFQFTNLKSCSFVRSTSLGICMMRPIELGNNREIFPNGMIIASLRSDFGIVIIIIYWGNHCTYSGIS